MSHGFEAKNSKKYEQELVLLHEVDVVDRCRKTWLQFVLR